MTIFTDSIDVVVTIVPFEKVTTTERVVLQALEEAIALHGNPSLTEIAHCAGLSHAASVRKHLQGLEAKGLVKLMPGRSRGVRLVREAGD